MENIVTFKMSAQEIKKDKKTFCACSANINEKWYKVKFTQDCANSPRKKGIYDLTVDIDNCSIEKGKPYKREDGTTGTSNDVIWVREITKIRQYSEDELKAMNRVAMEEVFG